MNSKHLIQGNPKHLGQSGQGLTEYIALLVLICIVSVGVTKSLGSTIKDKIQTARKHINSDITFE